MSIEKRSEAHFFLGNIFCIRIASTGGSGLSAACSHVFEALRTREEVRTLILGRKIHIAYLLGNVSVTNTLPVSKLSWKSVFKGLLNQIVRIFHLIKIVPGLSFQNLLRRTF